MQCFLSLSSLRLGAVGKRFLYKINGQWPLRGGGGQAQSVKDCTKTSLLIFSHVDFFYETKNLKTVPLISSPRRGSDYSLNTSLSLFSRIIGKDFHVRFFVRYFVSF